MRQGIALPLGHNDGLLTKCSATDSSSSSVGLLERRQNALRMHQELPSTPEEAEVIEHDQLIMDRLLAKLGDQPTPAGHRPSELRPGFRPSPNGAPWCLKRRPAPGRVDVRCSYAGQRREDTVGRRKREPLAIPLFREVTEEEWEAQQQIKRCSLCGVLKAADQFDRDSQKGDGLSSRCKECHRSNPCTIPGCTKPAVSQGLCAMHGWRLRERGSPFWEPERAPEVPPGYKLCPACDQVKPHETFSRCSSTSDGLQSACKDCRREMQRRARAKAREEGRLPSFEVSVESKRCTNCGVVKPRDQFSRNRANRDGLFSWCKECWQEHDRAYYTANAEKCRQKTRNWRRKNPERARVYDGWYWRSHRPQVYAKNRRYRERHPDRVREQRKAARERDPEGTRARKRAERERNKVWYRAYEEWRYYNQPGRMESSKARAAQWTREHRVVMLVYGHIRRARVYKAEGSHTADDIRRIYEEQGALCYYCQVPLNGRFHVDHKQPISRDGSDWPKNLACTCAKCNLRKGDMTEQEFWDKLARLEKLAGMTWAEAAAEAGLKRETLTRRIARSWSLDEVLSIPVGQRRRS